MEASTSSECPGRIPWRTFGGASSLTKHPTAEYRKVMLAVATALAQNLKLGTLSDGAYHGQLPPLADAHIAHR